MFRPINTLRSALLFFLLTAAFSLEAQRFQPVINNYLQQERATYRLSSNDIANWVISDQYDNPKTGVTYTYINQQVSGIRVFNAVSTVAIRDNRIAHFANHFYADADKKANSVQPALTAEQAIDAAAQHLGLRLTEPVKLENKDSDRLRYTFTKGGIAREVIRAELVLVPEDESLQLAWNIMIAPVASADWWNVRVDAMDGSFIEKNNWTTYCQFDSEDHDNNVEPSLNLLPGLNEEHYRMQSDSGKYNVFPLPVEAPSFGAPGLLKDPHNLVASPYGWHDTDGIDGAEFTITRGNNVYAYDDPQNIDVPGYSPDGGPALNFDFPIDLFQSTAFNKDAALTNLFYLNNTLHDILYVHGFDESAGNFQATNYTSNGLGNDFVLAEGQDGGGTNNANFGTPEDGFSGRMQMYMWDVAVEASMKILSPLSIAGYYVAVPSSFGPSLQNTLTGYTAIVNDGVDPTANACDSILNPEDLVGKIAIIDRGGCIFYDKVHAAELAGAIGVIVVNVGSSRVDLQACKLEYSIVSPK